MNSKKTSLILGMAVALTLGIAIMFASPLSATTNMDGGMMMSSHRHHIHHHSSLAECLVKVTSYNQDYMQVGQLQAYKMIRMENLHGLFLVYGKVV